EPIKRFRDVMEVYRDEAGFNIAYMGLENQTHPDKWMPIRVMGYDWMTYDRQLNEGHESERKIIPVYTVVLYFGYNKQWTAPRSLRDYFEVPKSLEPFFNDYPIHVIELAWLTDEEIEALSGDLKVVAMCLRCMRKKEFDNIPKATIKRVEAVFALLAKISGNHDFEDLIEKYRSKENVTMADAFEPIREVFRAEGWKLGVDEGRRLGVDEGRKLGMEDVARNLIAMHVLSRGDIAKATGLEIDEVRALEEAHCPP
ncbi:MAG: Rpn family recombination-promoting nuclease/putative transposase, partial [Bradymonadales bacterium]|nr:Rpn family recombination-promoting nuclease/putative transposase [Bradymonadales bacterium]